MSLLVHLVLVLILGGTVLFTSEQAPEGFTGQGEGFITGESGDEGGTPPETAPSDTTVPEMTMPTPAVESPVDALTTVSTVTPAFSLPNPATAFAAPPPQLASALKSVGAGSGLGKGPAGGAGGLGLGRGRLFGSPSAQEGVIGRFCDLRRGPDGEDRGATVSGTEYLSLVDQLIGPNGAVNEASLGSYFRPQDTLRTSFLLIPPLAQDEAPKAFGQQSLPGYAAWLTTYKGRLRADRPGNYRFVGGADELLIVRVNGRVVLDATWRTIPWANGNPTGVQPESSIPWQSGGAVRFGDALYFGSWVNLSQPFDIEITIGEGWGGDFAAVLLIEKQGVDYGNGPRPLFKMKGYESALTPEVTEILKANQAFITLDGPTF